MKQYIKVILSMLCLIFCFSSTAEAEFEWNHPCTWGGGVYDFCDENGNVNISESYDFLADSSKTFYDLVFSIDKKEALEKRIEFYSNRKQGKEKLNSFLESSGLTLSQTPETLLKQYTDKIKIFEKKFSDGAKNLFLALAIIGMVWSFGQLALKGSEFSNIGFEVVRVMLVVGFFWWLIAHAPTVLFSLFDKFGKWVSVGYSGVGVGIASTSDLFPRAMSLCQKLFNPSYVDLTPSPTWFCYLVNIVFGLFILITVMFIFINMVIMNVEFVFMAYVGIFILGLAGASWTRDLAITYLRKLLGISMSYFGLLMICNIGIMTLESPTVAIVQGVLENPYANVGALLQCEAILFLIFMVLAKLVKAIPNTISHLVGGGASEGYNVTAGAGRIAQTAGGAVGASVGTVGKAVGGTAFGIAKGTVLGTARAGRSILGGQFRGAGSEFASGFSGFGSFAKNMFTPKPFRTMDGGANAFSNIGKK